MKFARSLPASHRSLLFVGVFLVASSSCWSDASNTPSRVSARILTPRTWEDTIEAFAPTPLTIEVRDWEGKPAVAAPVTLGSKDDGPYFGGLAWFSPSQDWQSATTVLGAVTDAQGQLTVTARLGTRVASGWITLDAGPAGRDSIHVMIRAGMPARFTLGPRDTVLTAGASYTLSATGRDRGFNVLDSVAPTLVVRGSQVATSAGLTVRTAQPGATFVVGTLGTLIDSTALEVVPRGTLVAFSYRSGAIATFDLDGSNYQRISLLPSFASNTHAPRWRPQSNTLVFHGPVSGSGGVGLFTMDLSNQPTVLYTPATQADGMYPQPTRDGAWIYYTQRVGFQSAEIWRMAADGSGRMRVGPVAGYYDSNSQPTPSPDGRSLVYAQNNGGNGTGMQLSRLDLATGTSTALPAFGTHPRWSPAASEIVYLRGNVRVVQADGTGDRVLASYFYGFDDADGQLDWSPDGKWLVACTLYQYGGDRRLVLIERASGEVIPLPYTYADKLCEAAWIR